MYEIEDLEGEPVISKFYEKESSVVDKILKRKKVNSKKMVLVE